MSSVTVSKLQIEDQIEVLIGASTVNDPRGVTGQQYKQGPKQPVEFATVVSIDSYKRNSRSKVITFSDGRIMFVQANAKVVVP